MRYVKFRIVTDEEMGETGILPNIFKNWENYSPAVAVGALGHDLIEHGCAETGAFHQEIAATGSFLFGRVFSGLLPSFYQTDQERTVANFPYDWRGSNIDYIPPVPKVLILNKDDHELLDEFFVGMREIAIKNWKAEQSFDENEECPYTSDENWPKVLGWLKFGYARAKQRYGDDYTAGKLVSVIDDAVLKEWSTLQMYVDSDIEFTLVIDKENISARIEGKYI